MAKVSAGKLIGAVIGLALLGGAVWLMTPPIGYNEGYQPKQPIPFDHALHAGKNQMQCNYCHSSVEYSKQATVPSTNICMNCHMVVATDRPWIKELSKYHERGESVQWVKVHMLPDHVQFNHRRHMLAGKNISCQTCHGAVEEMQVVRQNSTLSMGWCINCHRKPEYNAPINCSTCHY